MENGIIIKCDERGVFINGEHRADMGDLEQFRNIVSEYFFYEYWKDKRSHATQGELTSDSMFLGFGVSPPIHKFGFEGSFTHFSDPKFAAGYLKYIILGKMACTLLLSNEEYDEICFKDDGDLRVFVMPDVDDILDMCIKNGSERAGIIEKMNHIIRLCNEVFIKQDVLEAKELLNYLSAKFNDYFGLGIVEETGWNYTFDVYNKKDEVEYITVEQVVDSKRGKQLKKAFFEKHCSEKYIDMIKETRFKKIWLEDNEILQKIYSIFEAN